MGGQAFATSDPPLPTPRMSPEIYAQVLAETHAILRKHYSHVESAIEAPEKETYGDIDTLVFGPLDPAWSDSEDISIAVVENLAKALTAKKFVRQKRSRTINFAVPWPEDGNSDGDEEAKYVQLDVHICHTLPSFKWEVFRAAHGDLWNILGSTIRSLGLTVNSAGMYIRIPEIESYDRKKSMIFLTADPSQILRFLGLDEKRWWKPFNTREEMFEYAAGCRMFWVKEADDSATAGDNPPPVEATKSPGVEGQEGGEKGKKQLKHNDRQRIKKRPIFKEWMDDFIPRCRERGVFTTGISRGQVHREALAEFGVREEYETRVREWKLAKHQDELWRLVIKGSVPEDIDPPFRAASLKTLKAIIVEGGEFDGIYPKAAKNDTEGFYDIEEVKRFVLGNWKRAGEIGVARHKAKSSELMKAKAERKERDAAEASKHKDNAI